jgi:hypothetical protein
MAALSAGKIAEVLFENFIETFESQQMLLPMVDHWVPEAGDLQNAGNFIWRTVQQHAPILTGFDLTDDEQPIIEETYPAVLGEPINDYPELRIDNMRDMGFWQRRGVQSGRRMASYLNSAIASAMATQGSLFYRSNTTDGFTFLGTAQTMMNERQLPKNDQRYFLLNDRDTLQYAAQLAGRQTLQGRPEEAWATGQIGRNVAEFDAYTGSFLPNLAGGTSPDATVTGNQSFAPEGGTVNTTTGVVTNVDYRQAVIPVSAADDYNVGDKVIFTNAGVPVYAIGLDDKTNTEQPMTFTVVAVNADDDELTIYPKPIALDDTGNLDTTELAYANVNTRILNGAVVARQNTDALVKTNLFWAKDAVEVIGGALPANLMKEFAGKKVLTERMKNGQPMYMIYDGNVSTLQLKFRLLSWYGVTVRNPSAVGVAVDYYSTT